MTYIIIKLFTRMKRTINTIALLTVLTVAAVGCQKETKTRK